MPEYIPSTIPQIRDLIGAMVLCMPEMELPDSGLGFDGAYGRLQHCLGLVRHELGEAQYRRLMDMAAQSKQKLQANELKAGLFFLQDMMKSIRKRR